MINIIFLDIDGVLNTDENFKSLPKFEPKHKHEKYLMPESIDLVNKLAEKHNALIVVSSTWRKLDKKFNTHEWASEDSKNFDLKDFLKRSGLKAKFHKNWHTPLPERFSEMINGRPRGFEIGDWFEEYGTVDNWVALDDLSWGFYDDKINHLAQTNSKYGFTEKEYVKADKILSGLLDE